MRKKAKEPPPRTDRACAAGHCRESGEYKAPKSRFESGEYQYLCLEHIREFNRAWDYFDGWGRDEIETFMHSVVHGHRPTWSMSSRVSGNQPHFSSEALRDSFYRMLGEKAPGGPKRRPESRAQRKEREAFSMLDLEPGATLAMVKTHYKKLVKKYHPDVNKGNKASEETFKRITAAYSLLIKNLQDTHED